MPLSTEQLNEIAAHLAKRPGHTAVTSTLARLLTEGLGARPADIDFEKPLPEVHGRLDALLGRTVFEVKSDLRKELPDAREQLASYLQGREAATGERYLGIATDGATFIAFHLDGGALQELQRHTTKIDEEGNGAHALLDWLSAAVVLETELAPEPEKVKEELGKSSLAFMVARSRLKKLWEELKSDPEVAVKRELWERHLALVYGQRVNDDELFFQHTYLTIVAKTMATNVLGVPPPAAEDLLSGKVFEQSGISGAVESDFFDWLLAGKDGADAVSRVVSQTSRFRLREVKSDILKGLYESLVDPGQRHVLGEYYTPDWLAARVCREAITDPLNQRVLDPACGSGTFLFHALQRFFDAADAAGWPAAKAITAACNKVLGIDIHPVAVIIARVTYLLAMGDRLKKSRPFSIPVYMGDALQWNTEGMLGGRDVAIETPGGPTLRFPFSITSDPQVFDNVIHRMLALSEQPQPDAGPAVFEGWLTAHHKGLGRGDVGELSRTYDALRSLRKQRRDHIWGFVARNLTRPVGLSVPEQRPDVVVGNPPWLSYRYMSKEMQERFRDECLKRNLWTGGKVATHQDMSGYFFVRCAELYLRGDGLMAFVMPYASLDRKQFAGFRSGMYGKKNGNGVENGVATLTFTGAWLFDENVQPLFPVPSCVLFARPVKGGESAGVRPDFVHSWSGVLPERNAVAAVVDKLEAEGRFARRSVRWPPEASDDEASTYRDRFRQGATVVPRMLFLVERVRVSSLLPGAVGMPLVRSRKNNQEKEPWRSLDPVQDNVEEEFVWTLYLGESVGPYRLFEAAEAVIPWSEQANKMLDAKGAYGAGLSYLPQWMTKVEQIWEKHKKSPMSLTERLDYHAGLAVQFPIPAIRVVFAASGTLPAAALLKDRRAVVEHKLYWASVRTLAEGRYLCAVLNSETARSRIEHQQSRGQWGARDFDKLMLGLPIPAFDRGEALHNDLAALAERAERVAAVALKEGEHFVTARRRIREALTADGVAAEVDRLVGQLLGPA